MRHTDYDDIAETYDQRYDDASAVGLERTLDERVPADARVLEVGCGTGHWLEHLRPRVVYAFGLDPSTPMLARASGERVRARAEALPFDAETFDVVLLVNALHHVGDKEGALVEARRVLAPGGFLLTIGLDPHEGSDRWYVYDWFAETLALDRERFPSTEWIRAAAGDAGFARAESFVAEHLPDRVLADEAFERALDRKRTSQLSILSNEEYARGLANLRAAMAAGPVVLEADLRLWGTIALVDAD